MKKIFRRAIIIILCSVPFLLSAGTPDISLLAEKANSKNFPDADSVLLYDREEMICESDGTSVSTDEFYQKILNEAGRKQLRSIPLHCNTNYGTAGFVAAAILRGGKKIDIDISKNSKTTTETGQMNSNIYTPEIKVTTLSVPGLEIGDVLYIKSMRKTLKPLIPGEWSTIIGLESDSPILRYDVVINTPDCMPLRHTVIKNEIKGCVKTFPPEKKDKRIIYRWQASDVPQAISEPGMPDLYTCCQRLLAGTAKDWQSISKWYYDLCRPAMDAVSDAMKQKVDELVKNAGSDDEKISNIFKFVSQEIRYTGITSEKNRPGFEPHDVRDTFAQRHGVCRDKAVLLVSMLELAGFKAFPVIFMAITPKDDDVPNAYFNHAVACVDRGNYDYLMMDPTDENTRTLFPEYLSNQSFLVARPDGDTLRRTPVVPAEKNSMKISSVAEFSAGGILQGETVIKFSGINDLVYRSSFSRMTPAKRLEFWSGRVCKALPGAEVLSLDIIPENIRDTSKPLVIKFRFKSFFPGGDTDSAGIFAVPQFSRQFSILNWLLPDTALESRRFPIKTESTCQVEENLKIKMPSQLKIAGLPKENSGRNGMFSWSRRFSAKDNTLELNTLVTLNCVEITKDDYPRFRDELHRFSSSDKQLPVIRKDFSGFKPEKYREIFPDADAVILDSKDTTTLDKDNTCTGTQYRKILILSYAGIKKHSEIIEYFYPSREEINIKASVTSADGKTVHLTPGHTRLMDAPWTADLKHIPEEKIKVCALPGIGIYSVIEYTITRKSRKLLHMAGHSQIQQHDPVLSWNFEINTPEGVKLRTSPVPPNVDFSRKYEKGMIKRTWSAKNISAVKKEYSQSPLQFFAPHITYSAEKSGVFAEKFNAQLKKKAALQSRTAAAACFDNIDIKSMNPAEKVRHIRDFTVRKIRVSGPAVTSVPQEYLRTPDEIFKSGIATSAERAILLSALLNDAGIKHRFHLAGDQLFSSQVFREFSHCFVPDFSEVLIYVPELNVWLNSESQYSTPGYTSYHGKTGLDLTNGRLAAINSSADAMNGITKSFTVKILNNRSAVIDVTEKFSGSFFEDANRKFSEMTPELTRRHFISKAHAIDKSARLNGKYTVEVKNKKVIVKYSVTVAKFANATGDYLTFELPGHSILRNLASVSGKDRTTPFIRNTDLRMEMIWKIISPDGFIHLSSDMRNTVTGNVQTAELIERRSVIRRELNISMKLTLPAAVIEAADFPHLISVQTALGKSRSSNCILKRER